MTEDIKRMDIKEFRRLGYLQELNRGFLHPLGLALEVEIDEDGTERFGGVWDYREDPEGILYGEIDPKKVQYVADQRDERKPLRVKMLGYWQQPVWKGKK